MKKLKKTMLLLMLAVFTLGAALPVQAKMETQTVTVYPAKDKWKWQNVLCSSAVSRNKNVWLKTLDGKITDLKSSKKSVASVRSERVKGSDMTSIYANLKKEGKTTISYTYKEDGKNKTSQYILNVKKYVSPVTSVKIGTTTIKGTKFKNTSVYNVKYSKFANQDVNVKITPAKGWSLQKNVSFKAYNDIMKKYSKAVQDGQHEKAEKLAKKAQKLPSKASFAYWEKNWEVASREHNGDKIKVRGGNGFEIFATLINNKTKQEETIVIQFR